MSDMVDMVVYALGKYYRHAGINEIDLLDLLMPLRTDYAALTNEKWNQDDASRRIIESYMTRLMLVPVLSDDDVELVYLSESELDDECEQDDECNIFEEA